MENAAESHLELLPNGSRLHTPLATSSVTVRQPINMTRSCAEAADDNFPFSILVALSLILCHIYVGGVSQVRTSALYTMYPMLSFEKTRHTNGKNLY